MPKRKDFLQFVT